MTAYGTPRRRAGKVLRDVHGRRWRRDLDERRMLIRIHSDGSDYVPQVRVPMSWLIINCGPIALEAGEYLPGPISDRIRGGQVDADLKYKGNNSDDDPPAPKSVRWGWGRGLGKGATRRRGGDETR